MNVPISTTLLHVESELRYIFKLLAINKRTVVDISFTENHTEAVVGREGSGSTIELSNDFSNGKLSSAVLKPGGFFEFGNGARDYISTAFFCVTSYQEIQNQHPDALGRFNYKSSYQATLGNVSQNVVQECFDQLAAILKINAAARKSSFFLSHDIDSLNGAIVEDGFNVLKKGRVDQFLSMFMDVMMAKPGWLNIDQILKIESEYDCRSVFYWIVNKGSVNGNKNADYTFQSAKIQKHFNSVSHSPSENGLHKSLSSESFQGEIKKFGAMPLGNRYHYLRFNLPHGFDAIEDAGIKLDASLGFSDQWGFRNSYGLPFNPYNFKAKRPYSFVEVPLHIMDRTFFSKRMSIQQVEKEIFGFLEKHRRDCVLSILWHNNFFSEYKYKGYLTLYKKILAYIRDNGFDTVSQQEIIENYTILWP